jgi:hypothetical protein
MRNRRFSKAAILSIVLTFGPATLVTVTGASIAYAQEAQSDAQITLELFDQMPDESSTPLSSADLTGGGDLSDLMAADNAAQGRYLRITLTQGDTIDSRVYRVLITPSNGRTFIVSPQGIISLDNLLRQSGLMVEKDNLAVTPGEGAVELQVEGLNDSLSSTTTDTSDSSSTMTDTSATTATDTSTATAPADTSASTTPADTSTAAAPADTSTATAPADTSATTTTTADSSATDASGQPLTTAVTQDLGKLALTVLPTSATAPSSSATNFYVLPYTDATNPTQDINSNIVTLDYISKASLTDVAAYYDKLMTDQGFTKATDEQNASSESDIVQVYSRGKATVTITINLYEQGQYTVYVDLSNLVQSLEQ